MRQSGARAPGDCGPMHTVPQPFNKESNPICRRVWFSARRLPQCGFKADAPAEVCQPSASIGGGPSHETRKH